MPLVNDGLNGLTYRINGICMQVHNEIGPGHREDVYHRALEQRFTELGVVFESEPPLEVVDGNGNVLIIYRPDFRVEGKLWLEIKALSHLLTNDEIAQVIDYFAADVQETCAVALLVNFGQLRLGYKRIFAPKNIKEHRQIKKWGQIK